MAIAPASHTAASRRISAADQRHAVFAVGTHLVGVPCEIVQEMFLLKDVRRPTGMTAFQRGVAVLRGRALPALDLRLCLGMAAATDETEQLVTMLGEREQDHRNWLAELEASVAEQRAFKLTTDPRRCKFGLWYFTFQTDDPVVRGELARFEKPHAEIHAVAVQVAGLMKEGKSSEAKQLLAATRSGLLAELISDFARVKEAIVAQRREIGIVLTLGGRDVVLAVDRAEAVADLTAVEAEEDPVRQGTLRPEFVSGLARWKAHEQPVLVLDVKRLAQEAGTVRPG
ncbi:MAG: chemotaxis protein CheW [Deltaproteobacteria bacterium]|nr:chemotaxis protein CheW [Deltaproteobacteria bacterium]